MIKACKGLTLVEILIASALMVVIIVPLGSIMRSAINSWQVIPEKTQIEREVRTAIDAIGAVTKQAEDITIDTNTYGDSANDLKITTSSSAYYFFKSGSNLYYYKEGSSSEKLTTHCNNFEFSNPGGNNLILIELTLGENGETYQAFSVPTRLTRE